LCLGRIDVFQKFQNHRFEKLAARRCGGVVHPARYDAVALLFQLKTNPLQKRRFANFAWSDDEKILLPLSADFLEESTPPVKHFLDEFLVREAHFRAERRQGCIRRSGGQTTDQFLDGIFV